MTNARAVRHLALIPILVVWHAAAMGEPAADSYCKRLPFDKEAQAGIFGQYDVVGKDRLTGDAYSGTLQVRAGKDSYAVTRMVRGRSQAGSAWIEACGPDRFERLVVRFDAKAGAEDFACYLRGDGDNFIRASCTTADGRGLEAWYQRRETLSP